MPPVPYRRIGDPEKLRRLVGALLSIGEPADSAELLRHLVAEARDLVGARYAALGVLDPTGTRLEQFITVGLDPETEAAIGERPSGQGLLGLLIVDPVPLRVDEVDQHPDRFGFPPGHPPMTTFLGVPVQAHGALYGNLYLTDKADGQPFTEEDEAMVGALAVAAGLAVERTRLSERVRDVSLLEDRDRIARDLHDTVIQRLFAVGLSLQGTLRRADEPVRERLERAVADVDETIRQIRTTIFDLEGPLHGQQLRRAVLDLAREMAPAVGTEVAVTFDGPVDTAVGPEAADQLLATAREALANVGRHSRATTVTVDVTAAADLCLRVRDDGVGLPPVRPTGGNGLRNMASRAEKLGGHCEFVSAPGSGTEVLWRVPLSGSA
jgi:signal transduction histidine kinase